MRKIIFILVLLGARFSYAACTIQGAANSFRVPNTQCFQITGPLCIVRTVTNNIASGNDLFVPDKTYAEWNAFYNNPPAGVTIGTVNPIDTFAFSRTVIVNAAQVGGANQTNFPMLFSGTFSYLATTANGGLVQSSSGWDIIFTSDAAGTQLLNFEQESYNATTGAVVYWVQIPSLSSSTNTTIYLWYGSGTSAGCVASQANPSGTWDSNYMSVWHLTNGTTLSAADSTSGANTGVFTGPPTATSGLFDGAGSFSGTGQYIFSPQLPNASSTPPQSMTLSAWINPATAGGVVFDETGNQGPNGAWHDSQLEVEASPTATIKSCIWIGSLSCVTSLSAITYAVWYYVVTTYNVTTHTLAGYATAVGGIPTAVTSTQTKQYPNTNKQFWGVGTLDSTNAGNGNAFKGTMDEVRTSNIARTSNWITGEFNNQSSPATFYTVGAQVAH